MQLSPRQVRGRSALKRFMYSMLYMRDMFALAFGRAKPLVPFKVEADPPSIYLNWEIDPARVPELQAELDLPFPLAPIRCVAGEDPFYCLTLNIYRVSGLTNGIRAEWSFYIEDPEGTPRYMVVEAQSDVSMDVLKVARKGAQMAADAMPESGAILDTLAHLVYVVDEDLDKAIEIQEQAVRHAGSQRGFVSQLVAE